MPGASPFISKVSLDVSDTSVLKSIQFTITPKTGSVTRPLSGTYATSYLIGRGYENPHTGNVVLPVYGLYDGYTNTVKLTFKFLDGSSKQINTRITTATFQDPCGYKTPTVLQRRTNSTALSYDFMMTKGGCNDFQPTILDTDGAVRWVGTGGISGRGLMNGVQKLFYLPEPHTDFIYAVISEELGLIGATLVLLCFCVITWRGMRVALRAPDMFGTFLALGLTTMVAVQAFVNISVVLGLMPTKGIPLPFVSNGGSSLLINLLGMGVLLNVSQHASTEA